MLSSHAQDALPQITVKNINGKIVVSWLNELVKPPTTINVQRSFDSLKNFVTIGSVLNPENHENGFADTKPLYSKMYYRVFISFEGGNYMFSVSGGPVKVVPGFEELSASDSVALFHVKTVTSGSTRVLPAKDNNIQLHLKDAETKK
ncbi:MAG TPA: hypothetical protein VKH37_00065, partial [Ferruginibacter sp.]|nr:hypothetical protein [Ferruginibacter sp.]